MTRPNLEGTEGELPIVGLKIPRFLLEKIDAQAREDLTTRSTVIRRALLALFKGQ